jgi:flagellar hook protein FlgE
MLRSMFSAVSGLRSHQTMMDVTGNNIANVNTAGYKATRTTFQETLTQLVRGGTQGQPGAGGAGGQNPMQIGLGVQVAATDLIFSQGASQVTGRSTDLAIQGDGFFVVQGPNATTFFARAGAFSWDSEGQLVTPNGERVLAYDVTAAGAPIVPAGGQPGTVVRIDFDAYTDVTIDSTGRVIGRDAVSGEPQVLFQLGMARFANTGGLERSGNGLFSPSLAAGPAIFGTPGGGNGHGALQAGTLEMSNVDLAQEFTNLILSQRGFQANARTITTSDELLQELVNLKR